MHLFLRFFSLAAAAVVMADSPVTSHGEFDDLSALGRNPAAVTSLYSSNDETTVAPWGSVSLTRQVTAVDSPSAVAPVDVTLKPTDSSNFVLTKSHASIEAVTPTPRTHDETGVDVPHPQSFTATADDVAYVNVPYVELADSAAAPGTVPPADFTVAFIGDQGSSSDGLAVLALIQSEGADMVLHQGDLDYENNPTAWDQRINDVLGSDFPYFASIGNHDTSAWTGYQQKLVDRLARIPEATCTGDLGVKSSCGYQGLFFILSGVGTKGVDHEAYIRNELTQTAARWRICPWHKNQRKMQIGGQNDRTRWGVYEACREGGAIIATAHEHSYSRTKTLISMQSQTVDPDWPHPQRVRVARGASFVFVSGLAGKSVRDQERCLPSEAPYGCNGEWASIYASQQGATHGALFCTFNVGAQADKARCYFKDIGGVVADEFTITNLVDRKLQ
ncbi:MAG: metallophosphoesterase [Gammaproteobacteria bacterium]|nr:metallophosphoesterase [Gammaproteobacteria bacterium]